MNTFLILLTFLIGFGALLDLETTIISVCVLCSIFLCIKCSVRVYCDFLLFYKWFLGLGPTKAIEEFANFVGDGSEGNVERIRRRNRYRVSAPLVRETLDHLIAKGLDPMMERRPDNIGVVRFEVSQFIQRKIREENLRLTDAKKAVLLATEAFFILDDDVVDATSLMASRRRSEQSVKLWTRTASLASWGT